MGFAQEHVESLSRALDEPSWLTERRLEAWGYFEKLELPREKDEPWRYTDLRRLGFDLEVAQLLLQARDGARQLTEVEVDRAQLLLQARAGNAGFTGDIQELVEKVSVDASHFLPLGGSNGLAARGHGLRGQQPFLSRASFAGATERDGHSHRRNGGRLLRNRRGPPRQRRRLNRRTNVVRGCGF